MLKVKGNNLYMGSYGDLAEHTRNLIPLLDMMIANVEVYCDNPQAITMVEALKDAREMAKKLSNVENKLEECLRDVRTMSQMIDQLLKLKPNAELNDIYIYVISDEKTGRQSWPILEKRDDIFESEIDDFINHHLKEMNPHDERTNFPSNMIRDMVFFIKNLEVGEFKHKSEAHEYNIMKYRASDIARGEEEAYE